MDDLNRQSRSKQGDNHGLGENRRPNGTDSLSSKALGTAAKGTFYSLGGAIVAKPLGIAIQLLISRMFGAHYFGLYALGLTVIKLGGVIGTIGLHQGGMRFISSAHSKGESHNLFPIAGFSLGAAAISGLLLAMVMFLLADTIAVSWFGNEELTNVLKWMIVAVPFAVLVRVGCCLSRGFKTTKYAVAVENILLPSTNIVLFLILYFLNFGFYSVLFSFVLSRIVAVLVIGIVFLRLLRSDMPCKRPETVDGIRYGKILLYSYPFIGAGILSYVMGSTDMIMLGKFANARQVGEYAAAMQVTLQMTILLGSTNAIFGPLVAGAFGRDDIGEIRSLYNTVARWLFYTALPLLVFVGLARHEIMHIFGPDFVKVGPTVLLILALGQFVSIVTGGVGVILNMTGHQLRQLGNVAISAFLNIALNLLLIPRYGAIGAAIATAISISSVNLLRVLQVYLLFNTQPFTRAYALPLLLSLIVLLLFSVFGTHIPIIWPAQNFVFAIGVSALVVGVLMLHCSCEEDRRLLEGVKVRVLNRRLFGWPWSNRE